MHAATARCSPVRRVDARAKRAGAALAAQETNRGSVNEMVDDRTRFEMCP
jgi:hypothetical protein